MSCATALLLLLNKNNILPYEGEKLEASILCPFVVSERALKVADLTVLLVLSLLSHIISEGGN